MGEPLLLPGAAQGCAVPPGATSSVVKQAWGEHLQAIKRFIESSPEGDPCETLNELTTVRRELAECARLAGEKIGQLSERLAQGDSLVPDTDPVRHVRGARARRVPDHDTDLLCAPDSPASE